MTCWMDERPAEGHGSVVPRFVVVLVGALVHFYAYNYLAKIAGSGLESGTLWLVVVPFTVSLLIYEGFLLIRKSDGRRTASMAGPGSDVPRQSFLLRPES